MRYSQYTDRVVSTITSVKRSEDVPTLSNKISQYKYVSSRVITLSRYRARKNDL